MEGNKLKVHGVIYSEGEEKLTEEVLKEKLKSIGLSYLTVRESIRKGVQGKGAPTVQVKKSDYARILDASKDGLLVNLTTTVEGNDTELNRVLSKKFREQVHGYTGVYTEYTEIDNEEAIYIWDNYLKGKGVYKNVMMPISSGSDSYLIPVTENLELVLLAVDEYYGGGDSNTFVSVDTAVVTESATEEDVKVLIEVMKACKFV